MPAIYASREYADAGGLAGFGTSYSDGWRLVGNYAGRILKSEKPSDLPVQQVSKTELVINVREQPKRWGLRCLRPWLRVLALPVRGTLFALGLVLAGPHFLKELL